MRRKKRCRRLNTVAGKNPESWVRSFCKYGLSSCRDLWRLGAQSGRRHLFGCHVKTCLSLLVGPPGQPYNWRFEGHILSVPNVMSWIVGPASLSCNSYLISIITFIDLYAMNHSCRMFFPATALAH